MIIRCNNRGKDPVVDLLLFRPGGGGGYQAIFPKKLHENEKHLTRGKGAFPTPPQPTIRR